MKSSSFIPDELLSAYIDRQVSDAEFRRVERALIGDPALQERLETLQSVVHLLRNAPAMSVPRPMTLSEAQISTAPARGPAQWGNDFWRRWMPRLAPAATVAVAALFLASLALPGLNLASSPSLKQAAPPIPAARELPAEIARPAIIATVPVEKPAAQARSPLEATSAPPAAFEAAEAPVGDMAGSEQVAIQEMETGGGKEGVMANRGVETQVENGDAPPLRFLDAYPPARLSWILGALLIALLILTWRVTIAPRRK